MPAAPNHPQEQARLQALRRLEILDTDAEESFDEIVDLAASIVQAPIALVSLVDEHRQWFKSAHGLSASETPREFAFCAHAILDHDNILVVNDASEDQRFKNNPLVTSAPDIRFYAGVPLHAPDDHMPIGTLCVIDREPRSLSEDELSQLQTLANQVERMLALRQIAIDLAGHNTTLENAVLAKNRFLTTISHDIRTPLNGIMGCSELLRGLDLPPEALPHIETMQACGDSLMRIIGGMLDLSRIESGNIELTPDHFDLRNLTNELQLVMQPQAAQKGLTLQATLTSKVPQAVFGDAQKVHQILLNLIGNSIKFTTEGSVSLAVDDTENETAIFTVTDTGSGIASADIDQVFEPFMQVGQPNSQHELGSGFGLSIAKALVTALNGKVTVQSELGKGSSFHVHLPLAVGQASYETQRIQKKTLIFDASIRVLVVDDVPMNRLILRGMLKNLGVTIIEAADGNEALDAMREGVDIVFMDYHMPVKNGLQATQEWRAAESGAQLPIIALTAEAFEHEHLVLREAGMNDILIKPVTSASIAKALTTYIQT